MKDSIALQVCVRAATTNLRCAKSGAEMVKIMNEHESTYWLEKAPVTRAIAHMAIPMMLGMAVNMIYSITDTFYIGKLNNTEMLAAITFSLPFTTVLMAIGNLFGTGGSTFLSRMIGEKKLNEAKKASSVSFYLSMLAGIVFLLLCLPFMNQVLTLLGVTGGAIGYTKEYIMIFAIGSPFVIANFSMEQTVRGEGASAASMIGMFVSIGVNIVLDPVFIFVFKLGIMGAAIATVLGNVSAVLYYVYFMHTKSETLSISLKDFKPNKEILINIFKIGISAMALDIFLIISCLLFNNYSVKYGDYVIAGIGISQKVVQISELIGMGLYMGVTPLIAVSYASGDKTRLKEVLRKTILYLLLFTALLSLLLFFNRNGVISLFTKDVKVIEIGGYILTVQLISTIFAALSGLITSMFQAFGKGIPSTIMAVARGVILIPVIIISNHLLGLQGVISSLAVSEILACGIGIIMWFILRKEIIKI